MALPTNPNVPSTVFTPDTYLYISTAPVTTGTPQPKNLLILAPAILSGAAILASPYSLTAGTADPSKIAQYTDITTANAALGRRSAAANRLRAALQSQPIGLNIYVGAVPEPTNSGFTGVATKLLTFVGTAVGSGEIKVRVCGFLFRVSVASGDTAATVAATTLTAMGGAGGGTNSQQPDAPFVPASLISASVPLTYVHRGETGNDFPVQVTIPPEITGLTVGPGTIAIATNGSGGSVFTIRCGALSRSISIANGTTPTDAATAIAADLNANPFPLSAVASTSNVILKYRSGWVVNRIQLSSTEPGGGQTYTMSDRHDSAGAITSVATVAGSTTYTALAGSGTPTLTTVLANRARMVPMSEWFSEFIDSTSLGAIATHVELYANGYYQGNQRVFFGSGEVLDASGTGLANAKDRLTAPSPALTTSWRYVELHNQDAASQAGNAAVSLAADVCAATLPFNFDGHILAQGDAPLFPPRAEVALDPSSADTAMRSYFLTVATDDGFGRVKIIRGVTAWGSTNREWSDFSYGRMFDDARYRLREFLNQRFSGKVLFTETAPRVDNAFTLEDVEDAVKEWMISRDGITVDGARTLGQFVVAETDPDDGTYIRLAFRLRVPREAHVKSGVISSAPAAVR